MLKKINPLAKNPPFEADLMIMPRHRPTLAGIKPTTIGAGNFHGSVRNGKRWCIAALMAPGQQLLRTQKLNLKF